MMVSCPVRVRTKFHLGRGVERKFDGEAKLLVKKGQKVSPEEEIARLEVGRSSLVFDLPRLLKAKKPFSSKRLLKKPGEKVKRGERLVCLQSFLFGKRILIAPCAGQIKELKESSGELVFLTETKKKITVSSLFWGEVTKAEKEKVTIETQWLDVFGVLGFGQVSGKLILGDGEKNYLSFLDPEKAGEGVFVFRDNPGRAALEKLKISGARGVVAGGVHWCDFVGCRRRDLPLLITEGLGKLRMENDLWSIFQKYQGRRILLEGKKNRLRIPLEKKEVKAESEKTAREKELKKGNRVRLVGEPGPIGIQGEVVEIGQKKVALESGFKAVLVTVKTGEERLEVPAANLEILAG